MGILPAEIVKWIDDVFPAAREDKAFYLDDSHSQHLRALLALVSKLDATQSPSDPSQTTCLMASIGAISDALTGWEAHGGMGKRLHHTPGFGKGNPVSHIRRILSSVPDVTSTVEQRLVDGRRDRVTQLLDRDTFDGHLPTWVDVALVQTEPLALVLGDIDHFKKINDTHGHPQGDAVLRAVSSVLEGVAHRKGAAYRYGGEELAIILPNHSCMEGVAVAERVRLLIEAELTEGVPVTMSFGVAVLPDHAGDLEGLVEAADKALYDAKNRGRNLVRFSGERKPPTPEGRPASRKMPEPGKLTEKQRRELRRRRLHGQVIHCPNDGAVLECIDASGTESVGSEFLVRCPDCGQSDSI